MSNTLNKILRWRKSLSPQNFYNKKTFLLLLIVILLFFIFSPFFPYLIIIDGKNNTILYSRSFLLENEFMIRYIHSIHLTPVEELYTVKDNTIILNELHYDTYSVGMPSELNYGEKFNIKNGRFVISNMNRVFSNINLRTGQVISNHTLIFNKDKIELNKITSPGSWIRFEVRKCNIIDLILRR